MIQLSDIVEVKKAHHKRGVCVDQLHADPKPHEFQYLQLEEIETA